MSSTEQANMKDTNMKDNNNTSDNNTSGANNTNQIDAETKNHYFNLDEDPSNHYTFFPIRNQKYYDHYKKQLAVFWTVEEVQLAQDKDDYKGKLTPTEREFIRNILAFFAASDGLVAENLDLNFTQELTYKEVATCLRFQGMMEDIHGEMYSRMVDNLIPDRLEQNRVLNAINTIPCVGKKAKWAQKWTNRRDNDIQERLVAWACVEGIQFSGSFCSIMWLGKRNLMPGLQQANQFIRRDEGSHTDTSVMLYNDLRGEYRLAEDRVHQIVREALDVEKEFILESIPCAMLGMNAGLMSQYLEYVSDRLLVQLGYNKIWNAANPFDFMEAISIETKTNFFERQVTEYNKSGVATSDADRTLSFNLEDEDF